MRLCVCACVCARACIFFARDAASLRTSSTRIHTGGVLTQWCVSSASRTSARPAFTHVLPNSTTNLAWSMHCRQAQERPKHVTSKHNEEQSNTSIIEGDRTLSHKPAIPVAVHASSSAPLLPSLPSQPWLQVPLLPRVRNAGVRLHRGNSAYSSRQPRTFARILLGLFAPNAKTAVDTCSGSRGNGFVSTRMRTRESAGHNTQHSQGDQQICYPLIYVTEIMFLYVPSMHPIGKTLHLRKTGHGSPEDPSLSASPPPVAA